MGSGAIGTAEGVAIKGQDRQVGTGRREEEGLRLCGPSGGKGRRTWNPVCSHRAGLNRLGGQQIPDGPHLGGCGHPVAPQGPEGIVGLARQVWEYGAQDREPFTRPGWVQPSGILPEGLESPVVGVIQEVKATGLWSLEDPETGDLLMPLTAMKLRSHSGMNHPALTPTTGL